VAVGGCAGRLKAIWIIARYQAVIGVVKSLPRILPYGFGVGSLWSHSALLPITSCLSFVLCSVRD
jgi:hypothetical protein